ncbi:MAG: hypothetical protein JKY56_08360 [Kofleriaceae bacterium]|nr:hypothetical protein [Kofleriaceae bacterium]
MMNIRCNQVQDALAANCEMQEDTDVDLASAVQAHLSDCESCSEIEAALSTLDDQFLAMPGVEPADALVAQLLSSVQVDIKPSALQVVRESPEFLVDSDNMVKKPSRPRWGSAVGICGVLAAAAGIALVATSTWPDKQ